MIACLPNGVIGHYKKKSLFNLMCDFNEDPTRSAVSLVNSRLSAKTLYGGPIFQSIETK